MLITVLGRHLILKMCFFFLSVNSPCKKVGHFRIYLIFLPWKALSKGVLGMSAGLKELAGSLLELVAKLSRNHRNPGQSPRE